MKTCVVRVFGADSAAKVGSPRVAVFHQIVFDRGVIPGLGHYRVRTNAKLRHKTWYDPKEHHAVVIMVFHQIIKAVCSDRRPIACDVNGKVAFGRYELHVIFRRRLLLEQRGVQQRPVIGRARRSSRWVACRRTGLLSRWRLGGSHSSKNKPQHQNCRSQLLHRFSPSLASCSRGKISEQQKVCRLVTPAFNASPPGPMPATRGSRARILPSRATDCHPESCGYRFPNSLRRNNASVSFGNFEQSSIPIGIVAPSKSEPSPT